MILKKGTRIKIKSLEEIKATLDDQGLTKEGVYFGVSPKLISCCGKTIKLKDDLVVNLKHRTIYLNDELNIHYYWSLDWLIINGELNKKIKKLLKS